MTAKSKQDRRRISKPSQSSHVFPQNVKQVSTYNRVSKCVHLYVGCSEHFRSLSVGILRYIRVRCESVSTLYGKARHRGVCPLADDDLSSFTAVLSMYYDSIDTAIEHRAQWLCKVGRSRSRVLNMTISHTCPTQLQRRCGVLRLGVLTSDAYIDVPSWVI
jgi:hypothetical protein